MYKKNKSGNALFMILIAIALLGGLTVLMARTGSQSDDTGDAEQGSIAASSLIRYAAGLQSAIAQLTIKGCSEQQISFERAPYDGTSPYYNSHSPADFSCHVFHENGGAQRDKKFPQNYYAGTPSMTFDATHCYYGVGQTEAGCNTSQADLAVIFYPLTKNICKQINRNLGVENPGENPPVADSSHATGDGSNYDFTGTFLGSIILGNTTTEIRGKKAACYSDTAGWSANYYIFYTVLIAR